MNIPDIKEILFEICSDERVYDDSTDLVESGLLDSYAFIELFYKLEEYGIELHPTRIDRNNLTSVKGIEKMIGDYLSRQ
ncbi:MAG: D-alanine--poly(phosphoribitol) ligase subunit 2 [Clostridia bacterium]|nr:D-alanine--poly(phosphoribitol) ligase subunit 2 [Clostridia bacterium]